MTRDKKQGTRQDMGKICNREPMGGHWQQAGGKMKLAIRMLFTLIHSPLTIHHHASLLAFLNRFHHPDLSTISSVATCDFI